VNPLSVGFIYLASFISTSPLSVTISTTLDGVDKSVFSALEGLGLSIVTTDGVTALEKSQWGAIALKYGGATGLFTA
ncbi:PTS sugar transporter subunit IIC, partial [Streptococcus suis]